MNLFEQMHSEYEKAEQAKLVGLDELVNAIKSKAPLGAITLEKSKQPNQEWAFSSESLMYLQSLGFSILCMDRFGTTKLSITLHGIETVKIDWKNRGN